ncbi:hypothetical protein [Lentzea sp. NPDC060358]|uniref:hypothetical protein n=1 Tax=Lentzea sp. NPDC060358 TaxID=3347103 RepID=UPI0036486AE2
MTDRASPTMEETMSEPAHEEESANAQNSAEPLRPAENGGGPPDIAGEKEPVVTNGHGTIVVVDVVGSSRHVSNPTQVRIRRAMRKTVEAGFDTVGIKLPACHLADRGDGVIVVIPAGESKRLLADLLPGALVEALNAYNRTLLARERIQLRLSMHAGEVDFDEYGATGSAIIHACRLVDAEVFRKSLKSSTLLAVITSDWFFKDVVQNGDPVQLKAYRQLEVVNKETTTSAWVRLLRSPRGGQARG